MTGYLRNSVPKDRVAIEFERDGTERTMKITLGEVIKPTRHVAEFFDGGKSNRAMASIKSSCMMRSSSLMNAEVPCSIYRVISSE